MDLKALIAQQRASVEATKTETVNVVLGRELVEVEISRLLPDDWQSLVAANPPRKTSKSDANIGYDQNGLPRNYPAAKIRVAGEPVSSDMWRELYEVLNSVNRNNVGTVIWGLNVYEAIQELQELGKAVADSQSASQGNRASRRVASKGGSPRK